MGPLTRDVGRILRAENGLIARKEHPELVDAINWLVRKGDLCPVLPGIYAPQERVHDRELRIRAALMSAPDAVLVGPAAAWVSFWPRVPMGDITLAVRKDRRTTARGYSWTTRAIPLELIEERGRLRYTSPAMTALDLCSTMGGDGIDTALRTRAATLDGMHQALALTPHREGNGERRQLLLDSRAEPWSAAERLCHKLLRDAGIRGWKANFPVPTVGSIYYIDVAFEEQKVAIEIDGRIHEADRNLFESDRWRQNHLALEGWTILRFTWLMLTQHPEQVIQAIRRALSLFPSVQLPL